MLNFLLEEGCLYKWGAIDCRDICPHLILGGTHIGIKRTGQRFPALQWILERDQLIFRTLFILPIYILHYSLYGEDFNNCQIPLKIAISRARRGRSRDYKTSNEGDLLTSRSILNSLFLFFLYMIYERPVPSVFEKKKLYV